MTTKQIAKILARAAELERQAEGLRLAVTILNGDAHSQKRATAARTIDQAIAVRRAQRASAPANGAVGQKPAKKPRGAHTRKIQAQRARTQKFLAQFSTSEPRPGRSTHGVDVRALGALVRRGYITHKDTGYLRTAKPFTV